MKIRVRLTPEDETEPKRYLEIEDFVALMTTRAQAAEDEAQEPDEREEGAQ